MIFGKTNLPYIDTNQSPKEISEWKKSPATRKAYNSLNTNIPGQNITYLNRVLEKVFDKNKEEWHSIQVVFAVTLCYLILNLNKERIQILELLIKLRLLKNLVSIILFM